LIPVVLFLKEKKIAKKLKSSFKATRHKFHLCCIRHVTFLIDKSKRYSVCVTFVIIFINK